MNNITKEAVEEILKTVRPFLQADDGDIELVSISRDGIIKVKLLGACHDCPLSNMTLRAGVEKVLMNKIPEIKRVEAIN